MAADHLRLVVDADTGLDDAVALALAVTLDEFDLLGVTTVAGNAPLTATFENTRRVLHALGASNIPVFAGAHGPLLRPLRPASDYHGIDGLEGIALPASPAPQQGMHAPEFLIQAATNNPGDVILVCMGPLTNLAMAVRLRPDLPDLVKRLVVMGGAFKVAGNLTRFPEFNIWADPEAASIVTKSGSQLTFVGLDVTHRAIITPPKWAAMADSHLPLVRLMHQLMARSFVERRQTRFALHDPLAIAVAARPELVTTERWSVDVDMSNDETAGQTRRVDDGDKPVADIALDLNEDAVGIFWRNAFGLQA